MVREGMLLSMLWVNGKTTYDDSHTGRLRVMFKTLEQTTCRGLQKDIWPWDISGLQDQACGVSLLQCFG